MQPHPCTHPTPELGRDRGTKTGLGWGCCSGEVFGKIVSFSPRAGTQVVTAKSVLYIWLISGGGETHGKPPWGTSHAGGASVLHLFYSTGLAASPSIPLARRWQRKRKSVGLSSFKPASRVPGWALGCLLNPSLAAFLIFPVLKAPGINLQDLRCTQLLITTTELPPPCRRSGAVFDSGPEGFPL